MAELESIKLTCSCGALMVVPKDRISFYSSCYECDTCGPHGETSIMMGEKCENCNKEVVEVKVDEW